jgi:hypothetical protein
MVRNFPEKGKTTPNFTRLDPGRPKIANLMDAMLRAREVASVGRGPSLGSNRYGYPQSAGMTVFHHANPDRRSHLGWAALTIFVIGVVWAIITGRGDVEFNLTLNRALSILFYVQCPPFRSTLSR